MEKREIGLSKEDIALIDRLIQKLEEFKKKALKKYKGNKKWFVTFGDYPLEIKIYDCYIIYFHLIKKLSNLDSNGYFNEFFPKFINSLRKEKDTFIQRLEDLASIKPRQLSNKVQEDYLCRQEINDLTTQILKMNKEAFSNLGMPNCPTEIIDSNDLGLKLDYMFSWDVSDRDDHIEIWSILWSSTIIFSYLGIGDLIEKINNDVQGISIEDVENSYMSPLNDNMVQKLETIKNFNMPKILEEWKQMSPHPIIHNIGGLFGSEDYYKKMDILSWAHRSFKVLVNNMPDGVFKDLFNSNLLLFDRIGEWFKRSGEVYCDVTSYKDILKNIHPVKFNFFEYWIIFSHRGCDKLGRNIQNAKWRLIIPNDIFSPHLFSLMHFFIRIEECYNYYYDKWDKETIHYSGTSLQPVFFYRYHLKMIFERQGIDVKPETIDRLVEEAEQATKDMSMCDKLDYYLELVAKKYEELAKSSQSSLLDVLNARMGQLAGEEKRTGRTGR